MMLWSKFTTWVIALFFAFSFAPLKVTRARSTAYPASRCHLVIMAADSIILLSRDSYCRGGSPELIVTGTNVHWYADAKKKQLLYQGNTYHSPPLDQTTTFYLTQTISGVETAPVAITIEMVEAFLRNTAVIPASCGKNDGVISVTATGGTTRNPLYYSLNKGPAQRSPVFTNLAAGTYLLMDSVATGCWGTINVVVPGPPSPTISTIAAVDPHCGQTDGTITVSAFGGTGSLSYSLNGIDFKSNNQFTNLTGGVYTITVKDQDQCAVSKSTSLKNTISLSINQIESIATTCGKSNGRITVNSQTGNGRITYSIDGLNFQVSSTFDSLAAGKYTVYVQDETGCREMQSVLIDKSKGATITHIRAQTGTCGAADSQISITATGQGNLAYSLNEKPYQIDSSFTQLPIGNYDVSVKDEQNCIIQQRVSLGEPCENAIYLPDAFTPNQDGINDSWTIYFPFSDLKLDELTIFNRWGEVIYHSDSRMLTSGDSLWNGMYKDQRQAGIYTYLLKVQFSSADKIYSYQGAFLLAL
jgi:gliding motility-associated-like protein